jgi:putative phosphoesterase
MTELCTNYCHLDDAIETLVVFSDVHGHYRSLEELKKRVLDISENKQLIFNGDLFCGGPFPAECADWVMQYVGSYATLGNHDEGMLVQRDGDSCVCMETGSFEKLCGGQRTYFRQLPHRLEINWQDKKIVCMHGHVTPNGEKGSWMATPARQMEAFYDPTADLCIMGHTHYAYKCHFKGTLMANSGSMCLPILGVQTADRLHIQSGKDSIETNDELQCSFLIIKLMDGRLNVNIVYFDYDRKVMLAEMEQAGFKYMDRVRHWFKTGIVDERIK